MRVDFIIICFMAKEPISTRPSAKSSATQDSGHAIRSMGRVSSSGGQGSPMRVSSIRVSLMVLGS